MKKATLLLLFIFSIALAFGQAGKYDMRLVLDHVDCATSKVYFDLEVRASSAGETFLIADQNYKMSFDRNGAVPNSVNIEQELCLSGFVFQGSPSTTSFFNSHTIAGSVDTVIGLNVSLAGGDGYFVGNTGNTECGFSGGNGWKEGGNSAIWAVLSKALFGRSTTGSDLKWLQ